MSQDNPKFGLKLALYCAIRIDAIKNDLTILPLPKMIDMNTWYDHATMVGYPVLKTIRKEKACYLDHVIESYVKAKIVTRTEANTVKNYLPSA